MAGAPIRAPPTSCTLAPLSFRAWLAAELRLTIAGVLVLRLAGLALRPAELDLRFPVPALRLAGLDPTSTLLRGRGAPDEPHM
jgi:hypothetical protein